MSRLTTGKFVKEGGGQNVVNDGSGKEERHVVLSAGHIQFEVVYAGQQAAEALLHLVGLDDLVV